MHVCCSFNPLLRYLYIIYSKVVSLFYLSTQKSVSFNGMQEEFPDVYISMSCHIMMSIIALRCKSGMFWIMFFWCKHLAFTYEYKPVNNKIMKITQENNHWLFSCVISYEVFHYWRNFIIIKSDFPTFSQEIALVSGTNFLETATWEPMTIISNLKIIWLKYCNLFQSSMSLCYFQCDKVYLFEMTFFNFSNILLISDPFWTMRKKQKTNKTKMYSLNDVCKLVFGTTYE